MKKDSRVRFEEKLAKEHACYVLITCDQPNQEGFMNVKMSHGGDPLLASFLIQGAQDAMDEEMGLTEEKDTELQII